MVGYQGLSMRPVSQRQSGTAWSTTQTRTPSAPARCASAVSAVMTRSSPFSIAAVSLAIS